MVGIIVRPCPQVEPDKRAAALSCDAPLLQPVHIQYTKRSLTALNHRCPQRRTLSNTNGLHVYQRPPATQTMTSRLNGPAVRRASAGPRKQAFRQRTPPLPGSVAVAVLAAPTTMSVSYTGTTTRTFTATTDQPLDGGGLRVEIFEKTMPSRIQHLGGCNSRTTTFKGPAASRTFAGHICRHFGVHQQHVPAGRAGRELQPGDTSALGNLPGGQRDDHDEHELSLSGDKWSEISTDRGSLNTRRLGCGQQGETTVGKSSSCCSCLPARRPPPRAPTDGLIRPVCR